MAGVLAISEFYLENGVKLHALVTWDPANPGESAQAEMTGDRPGGGTWEEYNEGVAFLHLFRDGSSLRFETWGTDTNGDYSAEAIDIFTLPINLAGAFPASLGNTQVPSPHQVWTYLLRPVPGNPNGFYLDAGRGVVLPPGNAQVGISVT